MSTHTNYICKTDVYDDTKLCRNIHRKLSICAQGSLALFTSFITP